MLNFSSGHKCQNETQTTILDLKDGENFNIKAQCCLKSIAQNEDLLFVTLVIQTNILSSLTITESWIKEIKKYYDSFKFWRLFKQKSFIRTPGA